MQHTNLCRAADFFSELSSGQGLQALKFFLSAEVADDEGHEARSRLISNFQIIQSKPDS